MHANFRHLFSALIITSSFFVSSHALAGLFVEPLTLLSIAGSTEHQGEDYATKQFNFGSRFGYMQGRSFLGVEAIISSWSISSPDNSVEEDFTGLSAGLVLGYELSIFRFFASYYFHNAMVSDVDSSTLNGNGFSLGASVGGSNRFNLMLTYEIMHYNERVSSSGDVTDLNGGLAIKPQILLLGISYPLSF